MQTGDNRTLIFWLPVGAVALVLLVTWLPYLIFPSVDDIHAIYGALVVGGKQSWTMSPSLDMNRLVLMPVFAATDALGIPSYVLAAVAYLLNVVLIPLLFALVLKTVNPSIGPVTLALLLGFACFHPGLAEAEHFWIIRVNLTVSYLAMIAFVLAWGAYPTWRLASTAAMIAAVGLSYQGYLNIALAILTLLAAADIRDRQESASQTLRYLLTLALGVVVGIAVIAFGLFLVKLAGADRPDYFIPLALDQIPAKIVRVFRFYREILWGHTGFPNVPSGAVIVVIASALTLLGLALDIRARTIAAVVFAIFGTSLAAMQLPSLPFSQQFYAMRSYPQIYLGLAGIICVALPASITTRRYLKSACVSGAGVLLAISLMISTWISSVYVLTRFYDVSASQAFVTQLRAAGFKWDRPVVVSFGDWHQWRYWAQGSTNSMYPILSASWSAHLLIGVVANRSVLPPTPEMQVMADDYCKTIRQDRPEPKISDQGYYLALCL
jgi:uncharacterized membrane protein YiaA